MAATLDKGKNMNTKNNDDFDFDLWLSAFEFIRSGSLTEAVFARYRPYRAIKFNAFFYKITTSTLDKGKKYEH